MVRYFIFLVLIVALTFSVAAQTQIDSDNLSVDNDRQEQLISYSKFVNVWRFLSLIISVGIFMLIAFSGFSSRLRTIAFKIKKKFFAVWVYFIMLMLVVYLIDLPFDIYRGFIVESEYGFVNQSFFSWFGEGLVSLMISMIFGIIPVWFFYRLVEKYKRWWLYYSAGMIPFMVIMIVLVPIFISPLFNDFVPLKDQALKGEIEQLASTAGIEGADIYEVNASKQSTKINAYVTGLFNTKRIVLYDTMIDGFTLDEIKFVMAHEMAHYLKNHLWIGLGIAVFFIGSLLWLLNLIIHGLIKRSRFKTGIESLKDVASLPLVMAVLVVLNFLLQPITNYTSRMMERESDKYAIVHSGTSKDEAVSTFEKLSSYNLSDPDPHPLIEFWFYSHPSLKKRIEFIRNYQG